MISNFKYTKPITNENWRSNIQSIFLNKIEFIEGVFDSPEDLTRETANLMSDELVEIIKSYDLLANGFNEVNIENHNFDERKFQRIRELSFYVRVWLKNYSSKIYPGHNINIIPGTIDHDPSPLGDIFKE